jgi:hypothetical protein
MRCKLLYFVIVVGWHGRGRWFESIRAYHFKLPPNFLPVISYLCFVISVASPDLCSRGAYS